MAAVTRVTPTGFMQETTDYVTRVTPTGFLQETTAISPVLLKLTFTARMRRISFATAKRLMTFKLAA